MREIKNVKLFNRQLDDILNDVNIVHHEGEDGFNGLSNVVVRLKTTDFSLGSKIRKNLRKKLNERLLMSTKNKRKGGTLFSGGLANNRVYLWLGFGIVLTLLLILSVRVIHVKPVPATASLISTILPQSIYSTASLESLDDPFSFFNHPISTPSVSNKEINIFSPRKSPISKFDNGYE